MYVPECFAGEEVVEDTTVFDVNFSGEEDPGRWSEYRVCVCMETRTNSQGARRLWQSGRDMVRHKRVSLEFCEQTRLMRP